MQDAAADLCATPNQHARPAAITFEGPVVVIKGYQDYYLTRDAVCVSPIDANLRAKRDTMYSYFRPAVMAHRTFLDLRANGGFFSFWALQQGATQATAVDIDPEYLGLIEQARNYLGVPGLHVVNRNIADWDEPADVVLGMAVVHWLYSCSSTFGSLDTVVGRLRELTRYLLLIEWVAPEDPAIAFFGHLDRNRHCHREPYQLSEFETALGKHFRTFRQIGSVSPTRKIYAAFVATADIDLSGPLPHFSVPDELLCRHHMATTSGIEYWSQVKTEGSTIVKEATLQLAEREAEFLARLGGAYFPRVLEVVRGDGTSRIVLERVSGQSITEAQDELTTTPKRLATFARHCVRILALLAEAGIKHRDIRDDNMLVRDGRPVLIDFGWSVAADMPLGTPAGLGNACRPPDGGFCDVFSMGKLLSKVNAGRYPELEAVFRLMAEPDAFLRLTDPVLLDSLLTTVVTAEGSSEAEDLPPPILTANQAAMVRVLVESLARRDGYRACLVSQSERNRDAVARLQESLTSTLGQFAIAEARHRDALAAESARAHAAEVAVWQANEQLAASQNEARESARYADELRQQINASSRYTDDLRQQHSTLCEQHSTLCEQHSTLCEQHSTLCEQHSTLCEQHSTLCEQHSTLCEQHSTLVAMYDTLQHHATALQQHANHLEANLATAHRDWSAAVAERDARLAALTAELARVSQLLHAANSSFFARARRRISRSIVGSAVRPVWRLGRRAVRLLDRVRSRAV